MTTKELRDALDRIMVEHPDIADAEVTTQGCDCDGDAGDVVYEPAHETTGAAGTFKWQAYAYIVRSTE